MIKFFRRIRQQLLSENKFSKYLLYAVGEILLVVIGILIALQVNNWQQEKNEKLKEYIILEQLKEDFETNDLLIKNGIKEHQQHINRQLLFIKNTGQNVDIPDKSELQEMFYIENATVDLVFGGEKSVISYERLDILKNNELKKHLSSFPSILTTYKVNENLNKDLRWAQMELYSKYFSLAANDPSLSEYLKSPYPSNTINWLEDRQNQNVATMRYWVIQNYCIPELRAIQAQNQKILEMINSELNQFD